MTLRFPAPFHSLVVFNLGSHWLLMIFSFSFWLAAVITLVWFYDTRSKCVHSPKRLPSWGPTRANEFSFKNTLRCDGVVFLRRKLHNVMRIYSTLLTENVTIHIGNGFIVRQTVEYVKKLYHVSLWTHDLFAWFNNFAPMLRLTPACSKETHWRSRCKHMEQYHTWDDKTRAAYMFAKLCINKRNPL